jgi:hypothetical protein
MKAFQFAFSFFFLLYPWEGNAQEREGKAGDTVEFYISAALLRTAATAGDLLAHVPGIEITEKGEILFNNRKIMGLRLDNRLFFDQSPALLLKSIPAENIEKIQIYSEKNTMQDIHPAGLYINIVSRPHTGHSGRFFTAYGSSARYESRLTWRFSRDSTLQLNLIGYGDNVGNNGAAFGAFSGREETSFKSLNSGNDLFLPKGEPTVNFPVKEGGIRKSGGGGFQLYYRPFQNWQLQASYLTDYTGSVIRSYNDKRVFLADSSLSAFESSGESSGLLGHRLNMDISRTPGTVHRFYFRPSFSFRKHSIDRGISSRNAYSGSAARNFINSDLSEKAEERSFHAVSGWEAMWQRASFSVKLVQEIHRTAGNGLHDILMQHIDSGFSESISRQQRETESYSDLYGANTSFSRKMGSSFSFVQAYGYSYSKKVMHALVLEQDTLSGQISAFLPDFSTGFTEIRNTHSSYQGLVFEPSHDLRVQVGTDAASVRLSLWNSLSSSPGQNRHFTYLVPHVSFTWLPNRSEVAFTYLYDYLLPFSSQLLDVTDNRNPNKLWAGNMELSAYRQHTSSLEARFYDPLKNLSFSLAAGYKKADGQITGSFLYDQAGRQVFRPENLPAGYGNAQLDFSGNVRKTYLRSKYTHYLEGSLWLSGKEFFNYVQGNLFRNTFGSAAFALSYAFMDKEKMDARISYLPSLSAALAHGLSDGNRQTRIGQQLRLECSSGLGAKFSARARLSYLYRTISSSTAVPGSRTLLDVSLTRLLLKEDKLRLGIGVYDLLNQNKLLIREASPNYILEGQSNALTRYIMLSIVYDFHPPEKTR